MIYSIGYGNRNLNEVIELLKKYNIKYLIDVRSKPYSQSNFDFNKGLIEQPLEKNGIKYGFFGKELGGRPQDSSCYINGKVDYHSLEQKSFYKKGIERLKLANQQGHNIVIMCSELRPHECHRSKLIGVTLHELDINIQHIDEKGELCDQMTVINKISNGTHYRNFFGELELVSKKNYNKM